MLLFLLQKYHVVDGKSKQTHPMDVACIQLPITRLYHIRRLALVLLALTIFYPSLSCKLLLK